MTTWKRTQRGEYESTDGRLYISRTRYGWAYGRIVNGERVEHDESTRPLERTKVLAERLLDDDTDKEENVNESTPQTLTVGSRVRRVRGTTIEGLDGTVRSLMPSVNDASVTVALVALDDPEPGIGWQFVAPLEDLELLPEAVNTPAEEEDEDALEDVRPDPWPRSY